MFLRALDRCAGYPCGSLLFCEQIAAKAYELVNIYSYEFFFEIVGTLCYF